MKILFGQAAKVIQPDGFVLEKHYYNKVINAQPHQLVKFFFNMSPERIIERYCHLHPTADKSYLKEILAYRPSHLQWSGTDLFHVTTENGSKRMVVVETNSSPSGQKSMPLLEEHDELGSYKRLIKSSFLPFVEKRRSINGCYAVVYDKNEMEASGYAHAMASILKKQVYLVTYYENDPDPSVRFVDEIMEIRINEDEWIPVKAAIRYVTQKPWNRIPVRTKTLLYNPIIGCLAGGRNKRMASKAYDMYNAQVKNHGLSIMAPETINDVKRNEVPLWVERFGGHAVIKNPYSNAGQGVFIVTCQKELDDFMAAEHPYEDFIVQSLIGNYQWSSESNGDKYYHVGMIPNRKQEIYVADLRFMIAATKEGYRPMAMYARRAEKPLKDTLDDIEDSWAMLGTNLSVKTQEGWDSETLRLKLMDQRDFNALGIGLDGLIEGYIQSVLATIAIDQMAIRLIGSKKQLKRQLIASINGDPILMSEII